MPAGVRNAWQQEREHLPATNLVPAFLYGARFRLTTKQVCKVFLGAYVLNLAILLIKSGIC
jgi:hypothetical protein